jgi:triacylglycerol esterase/lipase EstA (alpha/beta hydrolase family)
MVMLASCGKTPDAQTGPRTKIPGGKDNSDNFETKPNNSDASTGGVEDKNGIRPKLLFHGGGGMAILTEQLLWMDAAKKTLISKGVPGEHIYLLKYPHTKNIADIKSSIDRQLKTIFSKYPANTKYDIYGHSLGAPSSFISFAELGYLPRVRAIVSLSGVIMRQDKYPPLCSKNNKKDLCGDIFDVLIGPTDSPYMLDLFRKNDADMRRIIKCSAWSQEDGALSPKNAGVFPGGISLEMPVSWCKKGSGLMGAYKCHQKMKSDPQVFERIKNECFEGNLN